MKAAVVGATGAIGRRVTAELARRDEVEELRLCARDPEEVGRIASLLGGARARAVDLGPEMSEGALGGTDVVVSCAGPTSTLEQGVAGAAIDAGSSYVSLCFDRGAATAVQALSDLAKSKDATIVPGCGFSPGLSNLLTKHAAKRFDRVDEVEIGLALSWSDHDTPGLGLDLLAAFGSESVRWSERRRIREPAGRTPHLVYFPEPVGWVEVFACGHPEIETLPALVPDASAISFRCGVTEKAAMDVLRAATTIGRPRTLSAWGALHTILKPLLPSVFRVPPYGSTWSAVRVDVHGMQGDRRVTVSLGATDHLVNVSSVVLTRAAVELGTRRSSNPGVRAPEELFDPAAFMSDLYARGTRIARLESQPV
jgi:saccharopine dehydrogenase-like NADP-dependent oxidoreductase